MKPMTRSELFMATAAGEYSGELPEPVTRSEFYWQKIAQRINEGSGVSPESINAAIEDYLNTHEADIVTEAELSEALEDKADSADIPDVSVTQTLASGTKIGTVTVNGTGTDLYCETNTDTTYSAGTGLSLSGTTFSNSAPNVKSDWNAASGTDAEILNKPTIPNYSNATASAAGLMSAADKSKLDAINIEQMVYIDESTAKITLSSPRTLSESLSNYKIIEVRVLQFEERIGNTLYQTWEWVRLIKSSAGTFSAVPVMHFIRDDGSLVIRAYEIGISSSNPNQLVLLRDTTGTGLWTDAIVGYK